MYHHTIDMANTWMNRAFGYYAWSRRAEERGHHGMAHQLERHADYCAKTAEEYYVEADCHDWSKRG